MASLWSVARLLTYSARSRLLVALVMASAARRQGVAATVHVGLDGVGLQGGPGLRGAGPGGGHLSGGLRHLGFRVCTASRSRHTAR